jgi:hypothetical protein
MDELDDAVLGPRARAVPRNHCVVDLTLLEDVVLEEDLLVVLAGIRDRDGVSPLAWRTELT